MKDETGKWLHYAEENLQAARLLLEHSLLNPCLQNAQQAVEKLLKALLIESSIPLQRIHSINMLVGILAEGGITIHVTEAECDLLDAVYVPSKYQLGSALPDFAPDAATCHQCLEIAERVGELVRQHLGMCRVI
jgi:HEPN domain-containing protein